MQGFEPVCGGRERPVSPQEPYSKSGAGRGKLPHPAPFPESPSGIPDCVLGQGGAHGRAQVRPKTLVCEAALKTLWRSQDCSRGEH